MFIQLWRFFSNIFTKYTFHFEEQEAAIKIQARFRGFQDRKKLKKKFRGKKLWKKACRWVRQHLCDSKAKNVNASRMWGVVAKQVIKEIRNPTPFSISYFLSNFHIRQFFSIQQNNSSNFQIV